NLVLTQVLVIARCADALRYSGVGGCSAGRRRSRTPARSRRTLRAATRGGLASRGPRAPRAPRPGGPRGRPAPAGHWVWCRGKAASELRSLPPSPSRPWFQDKAAENQVAAVLGILGVKMGALPCAPRVAGHFALFRQVDAENAPPQTVGVLALRAFGRRG